MAAAAAVVAEEENSRNLNQSQRDPSSNKCGLACEKFQLARRRSHQQTPNPGAICRYFKLDRRVLSLVACQIQRRKSLIRLVHKGKLAQGESEGTPIRGPVCICVVAMALLTRLLRVVCLVVFLACGDAQVQQAMNTEEGKSVPLKTHSLYPPYLDSDLQSRWYGSSNGIVGNCRWEFGGDTVVDANKYVCLERVLLTWSDRYA
jgi:hypothetical protein